MKRLCTETRDRKKINLWYYFHNEENNYWTSLIIAFVFPVSAQIDDIQPDEVNLNAIYPDETVETSTNITGEHIKSFQSEILINKDGTIDVKESIIYDFSTLNKHGIYRDIPFIKLIRTGKICFDDS